MTVYIGMKAINTYKNRKIVGNDLEERFKAKLTSLGIPFLETGLNDSDINIYKDVPSSCRFRPDILVIRKGLMCFFEIKNSTKIERRCYDECIKRFDNNEKVYFVLNNLEQQNTFRIVEVQDIQWEISNSINNKWGIPTDNSGIWRSPTTITNSWTKEQVENFKRFGSTMEFGVISTDTKFNIF